MGQKLKVTGWKFFKDSITDRASGEVKSYDTGRIFVELPLDDSKGRQKGTCTAEIRVPDSSHIAAIKHLPLPLDFDVEFEKQADGKGGFRDVCVGLKPIQAERQQLRAAGAQAAAA